MRGCLAPLPVVSGGMPLACAPLKVSCCYCTSAEWYLEEDLGEKTVFPGVTVCDRLEI